MKNLWRSEKKLYYVDVWKISGITELFMESESYLILIAFVEKD